MRYIFIALVLASGCMSDAEREKRQAERAKSANEDNIRYWKWVERTLQCDMSERLGVCLCVFHHESGIGTTSTSEMGVAIAPNEACKRSK